MASYFCFFFSTLGSLPSFHNALYRSLSSLACARVTSEGFPIPLSKILDPRYSFTMKYFSPLSLTRKYKPLPSGMYSTFLVVFAFLTSSGVNKSICAMNTPSMVFVYGFVYGYLLNSIRLQRYVKNYNCCY